VHIYLTPHLCMEVLLLRGKAKEIKRVADGLIATKGVQHGKLVLTIVGREGHQAAHPDLSVMFFCQVVVSKIARVQQFVIS
jgi:hypothetical protein